MDITSGTNLTEITTPRQKQNGTRMFQCSRTNTQYGSYSSGYVRRIINYTIPIYTVNSEGNLVKALDSNQKTQYPLNKRTRNATEYAKNDFISSIMISNETDRLNLIVKASQAYKGYSRS